MLAAFKVCSIQFGTVQNGTKLQRRRNHTCQHNEQYGQLAIEAPFEQAHFVSVLFFFFHFLLLEDSSEKKAAEERDASLNSSQTAELEHWENKWPNKELFGRVREKEKKKVQVFF